MPIHYPGSTTYPAGAARSVPAAMWRGLLGHCPRCNARGLFRSFLKTHEVCTSCGLPFHYHRADDFPPYIVIVIVGHVVVGLMLGLWNVWPMSDTTQYVLWPSLALGLALALLQPVKGAVVGLQWALKMHGFAQDTD